MIDGREPTPDFPLETAERIQTLLLEWGVENHRDFPWRVARKRWHGLIAEVLLQRTRAGNVAPVYEAFVEHFSEPDDLAEATVEEVEDVIRPLGLRWRAPLLKRLGQCLTALDGEPPDTIEELLELPGVGAYSAAAYLSLYAGRRAVIIDSNVVRWICRMLDRPMDGETRRKRWLREDADALTPHERVSDYNYSVLDFTMSICGRAPLCIQCPVGSELCLYGRRVLETGGAIK